jgi:hypothetical protein
MELFKPIRKRKNIKSALGQPSAQGHRPNSTAARLARTSLGPSGLAQAQRGARAACGHHVVATCAVARWRTRGPTATRCGGGEPAMKCGGTEQHKYGESSMRQCGDGAVEEVGGTAAALR